MVKWLAVSVRLLPLVFRTKASIDGNCGFPAGEAKTFKVSCNAMSDASEVL